MPKEHECRKKAELIKLLSDVRQCNEDHYDSDTDDDRHDERHDNHVVNCGAPRKCRTKSICKNGCKNGKDGKDGKDGRDGIDGENGRDGTDGEDGEDGQDGSDGKNGKDGKDGKNGKDGKHGKKGDTGQMGPEGPRGEPGATGASGEPGPAGAEGKQGPAGEDGVAGIDSFFVWSEQGQDNSADAKSTIELVFEKKLQDSPLWVESAQCKPKYKAIEGNIGAKEFKCNASGVYMFSYRADITTGRARSPERTTGSNVALILTNNHKKVSGSTTVSRAPSDNKDSENYIYSVSNTIIANVKKDDVISLHFWTDDVRSTDCNNVLRDGSYIFKDNDLLKDVSITGSDPCVPVGLDHATASLAITRVSEIP